MATGWKGDGNLKGEALGKQSSYGSGKSFGESQKGDPKGGWGKGKGGGGPQKGKAKGGGGPQKGKGQRKGAATSTPDGQQMQVTCPPGVPPGGTVQIMVPAS